MVTARYIEKAHKLVLYYSETSFGGGVMAGQEDDEWPSYEDEVFNVEFLSLRRTKSKNFSHDSETVYTDFNPEKVNRAYMVVVRYSNGDTFSHSVGNCYIEGVYKSIEKADKIAQSITNKKYKEYNAWDCFFGGLEGVDVVPVDID